MFSLPLQLIGILPGPGGLHPYLLSTQLQAWQGFLRVPVDWTPVVRAVWACALYALPALVVATLVFPRRDAAGEQSRRRGRGLGPRSARNPGDVLREL
jgi:ABC-2 type transport system permease protein